jgi:hypothetical protein
MTLESKLNFFNGRVVIAYIYCEFVCRSCWASIGIGYRAVRFLPVIVDSTMWWRGALLRYGHTMGAAATASVVGMVRKINVFWRLAFPILDRLRY